MAATDYDKLKVLELKKLLTERALPVAGNKADLVTRLVEHDGRGDGDTAGPGKGGDGGSRNESRNEKGNGRVAHDDEIDWDEDDKTAKTKASAGKGAAKNPTAVPNQIVHEDPSESRDLKMTMGVVSDRIGEAAPSAGAKSDKPETTAAGTDSSTTTTDAPRTDFIAGLTNTDADLEAEKRAARAKRFGITPAAASSTTSASSAAVAQGANDDEARKRAERPKKFGGGGGGGGAPTSQADADREKRDAITRGLDAALPERKAKRARGERDEFGGRGESATAASDGRTAKRQTPDRRTGKPLDVGASAAKVKAKAFGGIMNDPIERAKAEARAAKFAAPQMQPQPQPKADPAAAASS